MKLYADGYCLRKNPSPIGGGWTVATRKRLIKTQEVLKEGFTNNEAELLACYNAILLADKGDEVVVDSQNTLAWINRGSCKARPDLSHIAFAAKKEMFEKGIRVYWLPREKNFAGHYNEKTFHS